MPRLLTIEGAPRSGITRRLVTLALEAATAGAPALLIEPTVDHAERALDRLREIEPSPEVRARVRVTTSNGVARQALRRTGIGAEVDLDDAVSAMLLERAADEVLRDRDNVPFARDDVRRSAVFVDDLAAFVEALKRARISSEAFEAAVPRSGSARLHALAAIYRAFQRTLEGGRAYDTQGALWLAVETIRSGEAPPPPYALVAVDEAQDLSSLDLDLLALIAKAPTVRDVVLGLRRGLATQRFRGAVSDAPARLAELVAPKSESRETLHDSVTDLGAFARAVSLLRRPPEPLTPAAARTDHVVYARREDELRGLACEVRALARAGAPLSDIAVLVRTVAARRLVATVLEEHRVPTTSADGDPRLAGVDVYLSALATLAECSAGSRGWERVDAATANRALALLGAHLCPQSETPAFFAALHAGDERGVCIAGLPDGGGASGRTPPRPRAVDALIASVRDILEGHSGEPLPDRLHALLGARVAGTSLAAALVREGAEHTIEQLGAAFGRLRAWEQLTGATLRYRDVRRLASVVCRGLRPRPRPGGVEVLTVSEARGRSWPRVHLPLLQHDEFPQAPRIRRLLADSELRWIDSTLVPEGDQGAFTGFREMPDDAYDEEVRLWLLALSRASEVCTLSCHLSSGGEPAIPSPFFAATVPEAVGVPRHLPGSGVAVRLAPSADGSPAWVPTAIDESALAPPADWESRPERSDEADSPTPVYADLEHLPLAVTSLETHWICPRRFFFESMLRLHDLPTTTQSFGNALHQALEELANESEDGVLGSVTDVCRRVQRILRDDPLDSPAEQGFYLEGLRRTLDVAVSCGLMPFRVDKTWTEKRLQLTVTDPVTGREHALAARIDAVHRQPTLLRGKPGKAPPRIAGSAVIDYKTGKDIGTLPFARSVRRWDLLEEPPAWEAIAKHPQSYQLPLYLRAVRGRGGVPDLPVGLARIHLPPALDDPEPRAQGLELSEAGGKETLTPRELDLTASDAGRRATAIKEATRFPAEPYLAAYACRSCPFAALCDEVRERAGDE